MAGFTDGASDGPIYMLNLLKYREQAEYADGRGTGLTGREAYALYTQGVRELLKEFGGSLSFKASVARLAIGEVEELWDDVAIAMYPSRAAMLQMMQSDKMQEIGQHRAAGTRRSVEHRMYRCRGSVALSMRKAVISLLVVVAALGVAAYQFQTELLLLYVSGQSQPEIGPNVEIQWQQGPAEADLPPGERLPNIIFVLADDLGINDLSAFGGGVAGGAVPTPNIDALAHGGVMFTQSYAGHGTCAPSRAMLMTGRYPTRTGFEFTPTPPGFSRMVTMMGNEMDDGLPPGDYNRELDESQPDYWTKGLPAEETTIAEVLRDKGYHTVHIGKWHLGSRNGMAPNDQGFDESLLMDSQLFAEEDDPEVVNAKLDFDPIDKFLWARGRFSTRFNGGDAFKPGGYLTDYWTDESLKVIEANRHRPFFLYLAHWGVHTPSAGDERRL